MVFFRHNASKKSPYASAHSTETIKRFDWICWKPKIEAENVNKQPNLWVIKMEEWQKKNSFAIDPHVFSDEFLGWFSEMMENFLSLSLSLMLVSSCCTICHNFNWNGCAFKWNPIYIHRLNRHAMCTNKIKEMTKYSILSWKTFNILHNHLFNKFLCSLANAFRRSSPFSI